MQLLENTPKFPKLNPEHNMVNGKTNDLTEMAFDKIYEYYYVRTLLKLHLQLKEEDTVYPSFDKQKLIVDRGLQTQCSFHFIDDLENDQLLPLKAGDPRFLCNGPLTNKSFFKLIHVNYLIPYLVFARFGYDLATELRPTEEELFGSIYQISLPIRLKIDPFTNKAAITNKYYWYQQRVNVLSTKNAQVMSHINTYHFERECIELDDGSIEDRFIEASILANNYSLHERFQKEISVKMKEFLKTNVFSERQLKIIGMVRDDIHISNKCLAENLGTKKERIDESNKEILELIRIYSGLRFNTVRDAVKGLSRRDYFN